jgi:hypothetical protein
MSIFGSIGRFFKKVFRATTRGQRPTDAENWVLDNVDKTKQTKQGENPSRRKR